MTIRGRSGFACGHNRIAEANNADILLIQNPDVVVAPRLFEIMLGEFAMPGTGMVEAKQLPIEHPKDYDIHTGETCWATTACDMIRYSLFRQLNGFDAESFFLYCDDVDFSWRVRLAGFKVIFQPAAVVFHDKRLGVDGGWKPSSAEKYYSAEAALLLDLQVVAISISQSYALRNTNGAAKSIFNAPRTEFERRQAEGGLPQQIDPGHRIGRFINGMYAEHRFPL